MIIKSFEISKLNSINYNLILLYGKNEGLKKEIINKLSKNNQEILSYEESEILDKENFLDGVLNKSLFGESKIIIIKRSTDKVLKIVEKIYNKNLDDKIIIMSEILEKKSKLRTFFEKDNKLICIPVYSDDDQTLSKLAFNFFREKKISISPSIINQIINKSNANREILINEMKKLENFVAKNKKITPENLNKLVNLSENYDIAELVDSCLAKNKKKIINILNENNFSNEDSIVISRTFLNKSKKILKLSLEYDKNKNIDVTISNAKPPIFWKEKNITKIQIQKWNPESIRLLIYKLSEIELKIKKNLNNSLNLITDFILEQSS